MLLGVRLYSRSLVLIHTSYLIMIVMGYGFSQSLSLIKAHESLVGSASTHKGPL